MGLTVEQEAAFTKWSLPNVTENTEARQETVYKNAPANISKAGRRNIANSHCTDTVVSRRKWIPSRGESVAKLLRWSDYAKNNRIDPYTDELSAEETMNAKGQLTCKRHFIPQILVIQFQYMIPLTSDTNYSYICILTSMHDTFTTEE